MTEKSLEISINNLNPDASTLKKSMISVLDSILGVKRMNTLYQINNMQGLSKDAFADKLISVLDLDITGIEELQQKIPKTGPVVIASNHPFGGIEGVILARAISEVRPDLKVLANKGLGIFTEIKDYFIFTNPLSPNDPKNGPSLRQCLKQVKDECALLLFPAGKVSYFDQSKGDISECPWNKLVGKLISVENCQYVPVFVSGTNSKWFYRAESLFFKLRMFLLARELLNKTGQKITINTGNAVEHKHIDNSLNNQAKAELCRSLSYAQEAKWRYQWPADTHTKMAPIIQEIEKNVLITELSSLPPEQKLISIKGYTVYYGYQAQIPKVVQEIARLRELVFREHNEGSGEPLDTDHFDATYTHLFIVDENEQKIIGAYRMGLSDRLIEKDGLDGLYLHKMFDFKPDFVNQTEPCLEMGRSFLIPEMQGSFQGLLLLWKGIGAFLCKFPQYRTLYGTVSISKLYDPRSVKLIEHALIEADSHLKVIPRNHFEFDMHPEIAAYSKQHDLSKQLTAMLKSIETDGKDIPVLAKQYHKLGAKFHSLGIDTSFNHTPGLLLSVRLSEAPEKLLKLYLGEGYEGYLNHKIS